MAKEKDWDKRFDKLEKSIDDLARITAQGFANVDKRFEAVDKRFESIEKRLAYLELNMVTKEELQEKLDALKDDLLKELQGHEEIEYATINQLRTRIINLERRVLGRKTA